MWDNELTLPPQKMEMIILKGPRKRDKVIVEIEEIRIRPQVRDDQTTFGPHIKKVVDRAGKQIAA